MNVTQSKEELLSSTNTLEAGLSEENVHSLNYTEHVLTTEEKQFLLHAERGDCATIRRLLEEYHPNRPEILDINCVDPLNRSALIAAIENENIELIRLLLDAGIKVKDSLLHSIKEEYVEAVELLLLWEEENHVPGEPYSWEAVDRSCSTFTPDITPLILAAHRNHYEILKILLDRGATLPVPHDVRCGCDECVQSSARDSLRHSQARINAYRALTSPSLIALSSPDPLLTAFQLSWELRRLSRMETEFRSEYNELRAQCQQFATSLLDHARTSNELEVMLNYNPLDVDIWDPGERQTLDRLKLAIKYKQKMFVAHPNVQQLLAAIWYEGLPGFRRKSMVGQMFQVAKLGAMFPIYSTIYMLAPNTEMGQFMKKPFVKFICHSSSYAFFLLLLGLASQRAEYVVIEWFGTPWMLSILEDWKSRERGSLPGLIECCVIIYIISLIWGEIRSLWSGGILDYINDLWNIVDFITHIFYLSWISLRATSWYIVQRDAAAGYNPWYAREKWDPYDPMLLSEGAFAAGMIFSFLKLVHIFSINPHLGPLQVSLGRMIIDIIKFFFIYTLVLFAFGCGMNQLMWYYADLEKNKCYHSPNGMPDFDNQEKACSIWRRFANLFETSQSLFWASFGLVDLTAFDLTGIKSFTRFWALLMFGSYSVINIIVLLNMLIAMMSNSYQIISERSDTEWKFARTNLWMSYFEEGDTVPPPFNLFPTPKTFIKLLQCKSKRSTMSVMKKSREKAQLRHEGIMRQLIRRYVTAEQCKRDDSGITEDDVMEIRQDISTLRFELIDILHKNGMKTPRMEPHEAQVPGKKGRIMERRLLKDFQIGIVEGIVQDVLSSEHEPKDLFSQLAKAIGSRSSGSSKNKDWNALVRKNTVKGDPIGKNAEALLRRSRQSLRQHIIQDMDSHAMDIDKLLEYNPRLSEVTPTTRVAYAKFMKNKFKSDYKIREERLSSVQSEIASIVLEDEVFEKSSPTTIPIVLPLKRKDKSEMNDSAENKPKVGLEDFDNVIEMEPDDKRSFRVRTPIEEIPDEEYESNIIDAHGFEVRADVQAVRQDDDASAEGSSSVLTRPLKSWSRDPSETGSIGSQIVSSLPASPVEKDDHMKPTALPEKLDDNLESQSSSSSDEPGDNQTSHQIPVPSIVIHSQTARGKSKATGKDVSGWI